MKQMPIFDLWFKNWSLISNVNWTVLVQQLPPLLLPLLCNIRGACLGKYWWRDYEKIGNGLASMILDDEYFAIFFIRILGSVFWHTDIMSQWSQILPEFDRSKQTKLSHFWATRPIFWATVKIFQDMKHISIFMSHDLMIAQ